MKRIIQELIKNRDFELHQIGLTPRTDFEGTQQDHDEYHRSRAQEYFDAIQAVALKMNINEQLKHLKEYNHTLQVINEELLDIMKRMCDSEDLQQLMNDITEWSDETFGDRQRNPAIVHHLQDEVSELLEAIEQSKDRKKIREEFADCTMLLLDAANHAGLSAHDLINISRHKLEVNKKRKWGKPDMRGVVRHIEDKV